MRRRIRYLTLIAVPVLAALASIAPAEAGIRQNHNEIVLRDLS